MNSMMLLVWKPLNYDRGLHCGSWGPCDTLDWMDLRKMLGHRLEKCLGHWWDEFGSLTTEIKIEKEINPRGTYFNLTDTTYATFKLHACCICRMCGGVILIEEHHRVTWDVQVFWNSRLELELPVAYSTCTTSAIIIVFHWIETQEGWVGVRGHGRQFFGWEVIFWNLQVKKKRSEKSVLGDCPWNCKVPMARVGKRRGPPYWGCLGWFQVWVGVRALGR